MPRIAKSGRAGLVEVGQGERPLLVGDRVAVQAEADAEVLGEPVGRVQDAGLVAAA